MSDLIIGSAGHIDHGKTALIRALTGKDLDTHAEEKRRGITINPGYTSLKLDQAGEVAVIDVPGHRDFLRNMIGAACGIDVVMMVVAADSGPAAQSREHLQILQALGIRRGLIVLTRIDLIDDDTRPILDDMIEEFRRGSFLEDSPVIAVDSLRGTGIDKLRATLDEVLAKLPPRPLAGPFRLPVDRSFILQGHGVVVTGTCHSGSFRLGDEAWLQPGNRALRVRGLQRHSRDAEAVRAGQRCSAKTAGHSQEDFHRGSLISDRTLLHSLLLDARFELFPGQRIDSWWTDALFTCGTYEAQVRFSLLGGQSLQVGDIGWIQIHLPEEAPFCPGDHFVLRRGGDPHSLGGGVILDPSPLHHRRRRPALIAALEDFHQRGLPALLANKVKVAAGFLSSAELASASNLDVNQVIPALTPPPAQCKVLSGNGGPWLIQNEDLKELEKRIVAAVKEHHRVNLLRQDGLSADEISQRLITRVKAARVPAGALLACLEELTEKGRIERLGRTWILPGHQVKPDPAIRERIDYVRAFYSAQGGALLAQSVLEDGCDRRKITADTLAAILRFLVHQGELIRIDEDYVLKSTIDAARASLIDAWEQHPEGWTVADLRDLIAGNRRMAILCFAQFEKEGWLRRDGEVRKKKV